MPRLGNGAGEPVQNEPVAAVGLRQPLLDDADDDIVGNQLTGVHIGFGFPPHLRAAFQRFTDNVTRGNRGNAQMLANNFRLGAFAGARRA